jgi:hypothetical protein
MATQVTAPTLSTKLVVSKLAKSQPDTRPSASSEGCAVQDDGSQGRYLVLNANPPNRVPHAFDISAKSVQFVACPGKAQELRAALPAAIEGAFALLPSFAGSMVLVANQEARRVTIITFWKGKGCDHRFENTERLRMLLFPYADHWLRFEDHAAHVSLNLEVEKQVRL